MILLSRLDVVGIYRRCFWVRTDGTARLDQTCQTTLTKKILFRFRVDTRDVVHYSPYDTKVANVENTILKHISPQEVKYAVQLDERKSKVWSDVDMNGLCTLYNGFDLFPQRPLSNRGHWILRVTLLITLFLIFQVLQSFILT